MHACACMHAHAGATLCKEFYRVSISVHSGWMCGEQVGRIFVVG